METPLNLRIFNTVKFRRGHRAEDWENRVTPPDQAYRYTSRNYDSIPYHVIEFDLNECLTQDSQLENFVESPPVVMLHLEYYDGESWVEPTGDNEVAFDPKDFENASPETFSVTRIGSNKIRVEAPETLHNLIDKYRLRVTLTQDFPGSVAEVG